MVGKKLAFWRESWLVDKNIIIANKSIKETENLIFFSVRLNFISLMNTTIGIFTSGTATCENTACGVHSVK